MSKILSPFGALKELVSWANNPYLSLVEGSEEEKALVEPIEKALEEWLIDKEFIIKLKAELWELKLEKQRKEEENGN